MFFLFNQTGPQTLHLKFNALFIGFEEPNLFRVYLVELSLLLHELGLPIEVLLLVVIAVYSLLEHFVCKFHLLLFCLCFSQSLGELSLLDGQLASLLFNLKKATLEISFGLLHIKLVLFSAVLGLE